MAARRRYGLAINDLVERIGRTAPLLGEVLRAISNAVNEIWYDQQNFTVSIPDGSVTASKLAPGAVTQPAITAGSVDATALNIRDVIVEGMTLTNNSPTSGNVAWSACTAFYAGTGYPIASGNTTSGHKLIYWTVGNAAFSHADSFAPAANVFLIATNTSGTADVAWNKIASHGIQESNLVNGLLVGTQIQAVVSATGLANTASLGTTTYYLDTTGDGTHTGGGLLTVGIRVNTARTGGGSENTVQVVWEVDNQTPSVFEIFTSGSNAFNEVATTIWGADGDGTGVGDIIKYSPYIGFQTRLRVGIKNVGASVTGTGKIDISILYCTKNT